MRDIEEESESDYEKAAPKRKTCSQILFNIFVGQLIAIGMVSGGIFT